MRKSKNKTGDAKREKGKSRKRRGEDGTKGQRGRATWSRASVLPVSPVVRGGDQGGSL